MHDATPTETVELYLEDRRGDVSNATLASHRSRLSFWERYFAEEGVESMREVSGLTLHTYKAWRRTVNDISKVTLKTQLDTLRVYIRFCERIEVVEEGLSQKVDSIDLEKGESSKDDILDEEVAEAMLDYLRKYRYASLPHAMLLLIWHTGARLGAIRGLDLSNVKLDDLYVEFRHQPEDDTPLKNKEEGERDVAISENIAVVLSDYIENRRDDYTEDSGREPLWVGRDSRLARNSIRRIAYAWTRPCKVGLQCPHNRDPETCDETEWDRAASCPASVSPHPFRRGVITRWLRSDVDEVTVGGRMDVSAKVIEEHYDQRTESEKMETRRRFLDQVEG